ncbi:PREDICTED: sodium- and chloride-dependent GABA transporter 3-like [Acropora digitifera]|uniref:sodium- and chloride-dependent GABA transporter 3-like n=1 Tax=Acropora digitifera TaxID=70779 RepID=UPI00077ABBC4|nr:PREDICTED: sodium- and chloride-dependent GABA transporter 3-like [Acropora digitifera]
MYVFQLFDGYSGSGSVLLLVVICETLAIGWLYGRRRFYSDMERMLGFRINPWIGWCWCFFAPTFCAFIFIFNVATYTPLKYGSYVFPAWGMAIAWLLTMSSLLLIPSVMIYKLMNTNGTILEISAGRGCSRANTHRAVVLINTLIYICLRPETVYLISILKTVRSR